MKLHLFFISLLSISSVTMPTHSMQSRQGRELGDFVTRAIALQVVAMTAGVSLGFGSLCLAGTCCDAIRNMHATGTHAVISLFSTPALFVGSCAAASAMFVLGVKDRTAIRAGGTIFGCSMLFDSLIYGINRWKEENEDEKKLCIGMGAFTGLSGLAALGLCWRK
jgi:hypothetical protein